MLLSKLSKILCILLSLSLLIGCSVKEIVIDIDQLCADIISTQVLSDEMMTLTDESTEYIDILKDILPDGYADVVFTFPAIGISSDMVLIVKSDDAALSAQRLEEYKNERYDAYMGYAPEEADKILNGFVDYCGSYAILVVLPDIDTAQNLWEQAIS